MSGVFNEPEQHPRRPIDIRALPIPHMVNMLVFVDFMDQPCCETYNCALMIVYAVSLFHQVVPCR